MSVEGLLGRLRAALASGTALAPAPEVPASGAAVDADLARAFGRALERAGGRLVVCEEAGAVDAWIRREAGGRPVARADRLAVTEAELRRAAVGVDRADLLVAEAGTVVRTWPSIEVARASLVPETSVFVAGRDALVRDLPQALARLAPAHGAGRAWTGFVTGPSRTADIEKQLVIPAHGPRKLIVLLVG